MAMHLAAGLEVMQQRIIRSVPFLSMTVAALAIGLSALVIITANDSRNGCTSAEAWIELNGRDTCYPVAFLPPELTAYLDGEE
jgi:hypothetical protein